MSSNRQYRRWMRHQAQSLMTWAASDEGLHHEIERQREREEWRKGAQQRKEFRDALKYRRQLERGRWPYGALKCGAVNCPIVPSWWCIHVHPLEVMVLPDNRQFDNWASGGVWRAGWYYEAGCPVGEENKKRDGGSVFTSRIEKDMADGCSLGAIIRAEHEGKPWFYYYRGPWTAKGRRRAEAQRRRDERAKAKKEKKCSSQSTPTPSSAPTAVTTCLPEAIPNPQSTTCETSSQEQPNDAPNVEQPSSTSPTSELLTPPKNTPTSEPTTPSDGGGYEPGHPWYYKLGGKPLEVGEIIKRAQETAKGDADGCAKFIEQFIRNQHIRKADHRNPDRWQTVLAGIDADREADIELYQELIAAAGNEEAMVKASGYSWNKNRDKNEREMDYFVGLALKHNHITYTTLQHTAVANYMATLIAELPEPTKEPKKKVKRGRDVVINKVNRSDAPKWDFEKTFPPVLKAALAKASVFVQAGGVNPETLNSPESLRAHHDALAPELLHLMTKAARVREVADGEKDRAKHDELSRQFAKLADEEASELDWYEMYFGEEARREFHQELCRRSKAAEGGVA